MSFWPWVNISIWSLEGTSDAHDGLWKRRKALSKQPRPKVILPLQGRGQWGNKGWRSQLLLPSTWARVMTTCLIHGQQKAIIAAQALCSRQCSPSQWTCIWCQLLTAEQPHFIFCDSAADEKEKGDLDSECWCPFISYLKKQWFSHSVCQARLSWMVMQVKQNGTWWQKGHEGKGCPVKNAVLRPPCSVM